MKKLAVLFLVLVPTFAVAADMRVYQGDTVIAAMPSDTRSVTFGGQTASLFFYKGAYRAVAGVGVTLPPGNYNLRAKFSGRPDLVRWIAVIRKKFPAVLLPVPEKLQLTPKQLVSNLQTINSSLNKETASATPEIYFHGPFGLPLADNTKIGSPFGEIRKTGTETVRHLGVDFSAATGTPVAAINDGVVKKSFFDPTYGHSVIIDHGQGIYSFYLHLNERYVNAGEKISKWKIIGSVGQTGFASGPHLHLSVKINGVAVDPIRFVKAFDF